MHKERSFWYILIISIVVLSANIGGYSIYLLDEAKNAECAREMLEARNWIVPTFNYELRTDKPPLHYYFMTLAYSIFGANEFAARIFSVLMGCLTVVITYWFTRTHMGKREAVYSSLVLTCSVGFILQFHLAVPDPYLVFFITLSVFALYHGYTSGIDRWLYLSYASLGLATLTKGPVGIVITGLALTLFMFRRRPSLSRLKLWQGAILYAFLVVPWFVLVGIESEGEWIRGFFLEHNFERFTSVKEGHGGLFLLTPLYLILMMMPFGLYLIPALWSLRAPTPEAVKLSTWVILVVLVIFSISATKLPNYVSPALPFASIVVGWYLSKTSYRNRLLRYLFIAYLFFSLLVSWAIPWSLARESIVASSWMFMLMPLGAAISLFFLLRKSLKSAIWIKGISVVSTFILAFYFIVPEIDKQNPVSLSLNFFKKDIPVLSYHIFNPAFSFYLQKKIPVFTSVEGVKSFIEAKPEALIITRPNVTGELEEFDLDTLMIQPDIFDGSQTVILKKD